MKKRSARSNPPEAARVAGRIVEWFPAHARDLPWRRTLGPYAIWVSEIMLQQTQVKTVIPYWERWMKRLPDVARLARAKEQTVLKLWEGLGYYSRARNLQLAARVILAEHGGVFPEETEAILSLKGVGRYTAGAIASIAFNQPAAILDGNVIRVLTRVFAIGGNPKDKQVNERLWSLAGELVGRAGEGLTVKRTDPLVFAGARSALNQGMMELGATVCLPAKPACGECPLRSDCRALRADRIDDFPETAKRVPATARLFHTFVIHRAGRYLVRRRTEGEVNAGFWEFPGIELVGKREPPDESFRRLFGGAAPALEETARLKHSITRYRFVQAVYQADWPARRSVKLAEAEWLPVEAIRKLPFYSSQLRVLKKLV